MDDVTMTANFRTPFFSILFLVFSGSTSVFADSNHHKSKRYFIAPDITAGS